MALNALGANRLRSSLTVLGLVIGIAAVIALMSIGRGAEATVTSYIEDLGTNLIFVQPEANMSDGVRGATGTGSTLTINDAKSLMDSILTPAISMVAPEKSTGAQVVARGENLNSRILGVTPEYEQVRNFSVSQGLFITEQHIQNRSLVAVLGNTVKDTLFGESNPIGQRILVKGKPFTVIGVLESLGGTFQGLQDELIVVPITTVQYRLSGSRTTEGQQTVQQINVQIGQGQNIEEAKTQIRRVLRIEHQLNGEDDFSLTSQEEVIDAFSGIIGTFTLFLGAVAAISLVVGGIGVMNIMLVSVTERTREIGIRKAIGATRNDILLQFLMESGLLTLVGGAVGVLLGWGLAKVFSQIEFNERKIETLVSGDIIVLALTVSVAIGLFFGIYPATRAAKLDPIEALRHQ